MSDDLFDLLIKVRNAAEVANGNAQALIKVYRRKPNFSYAANSMSAQTRRAQERAAARNWLVGQHNHIKHLYDAAMRFRDGTSPALDLIRRAVGLRAQPICVGDYSYPTAHEAAEALGDEVREAWERAGGYDAVERAPDRLHAEYDGDDADIAIEVSIEIWKRLRRLDKNNPWPPDLWGQIQQEFDAAHDRLKAETASALSRSAVPTSARSAEKGGVMSFDFGEAKNAALSCLVGLERIRVDLLVQWNKSSCLDWSISGKACSQQLPQDDEIPVLSLADSFLLDAAGQAVDEAQAKQLLDALDEAATAPLTFLVKLYRRIWRAMPPQLIEALTVANANQPLVRSGKSEFTTTHEAVKHRVLALLELFHIAPPTPCGTPHGWACWSDDADPVAIWKADHAAWPSVLRWESWQYGIIKELKRPFTIDETNYRTRLTKEWSNAVASTVKQNAKAANPAAGDSKPETVADGYQAHSPDFRSVNWFGVVHNFTPNQAAVVKVLWESWEQGTPDIGDHTLLEAADSDSERLDFVFRKHPAWGTMIVSGKTKGSRRLAKPTE